MARDALSFVSDVAIQGQADRFQVATSLLSATAQTASFKVILSPLPPMQTLGKNDDLIIVRPMPAALAG